MTWDELNDLAGGMATRGCGHRLVMMSEYFDLIESIPHDLYVPRDVSLYVPTVKYVVTPYGRLPLLPTGGGFQLFYACEYCFSKDAPVRNNGVYFCSHCGGSFK